MIKSNCKELSLLIVFAVDCLPRFASVYFSSASFDVLSRNV